MFTEQGSGGESRKENLRNNEKSTIRLITEIEWFDLIYLLHFWYSYKSAVADTKSACDRLADGIGCSNGGHHNNQ